MSQNTTFFKRYKDFAFDKERFGSITAVSLLFNIVSYLSLARAKPDFITFSFYNESWPVTLIYCIVIFVLTYLIGSFLYIIVCDVMYAVKIRLIDKVGYGYAIISLKKAFLPINLIKIKDKKLEKKEIQECLTIFCTYIRDLYNAKTGGQCCVSIHLFSELHDSKQLFNSNVVNFVRDKDSLKRNTDANYTQYEHTVINNTCYEEILRNLSNKEFDKLFYINNDLPKDLGYKSTSLKAKELSGKKFDIKKEKNIRYRRKNWPLEYRSEIVLPIYPSDKDEQWFLLGYFCIDCAKEKSKVFNEIYDVPLLQGVVDGIYDIIYHNADNLFVFKNSKQ